MRTFFRNTAFIILLSVASQLTHAQSPAMTISQKFLDGIAKDTCVNRAKAALKKFNLTTRDQGGEYILGNNAEYVAAIFCDQCGDRVNVNISVASNLPVGDAIRLREQLMEHISGKASTGGSGNATVWLDKNSFGISEPVAVHFNGLTGDAKDCVSIVQASQPDDVRGSWKYTGGDKQGSLTWQEGFPAGEYEARVYFKNSSTVEKRVAFTVR